MGQRVQVLVIKEKNNGKRKVSFFHHQWGIGRCLYLGFLDLFIQDYYKDTFKKGYDFFDTKFATNSSYYDITDDVPKRVLEAVNPDDFASCAHVFDWGDNNNGGMVVYIKEDKVEYHMSKMKVGFLLGPEDRHHVYENEEYNIGNDDNDFARWLTPAEFGSMNGGSDYSDDDFVKIFNEWLKYFDIEVFENITSVEDNLKRIEELRQEDKEASENDEQHGYDEDTTDKYLLQAKYITGTDGSQTEYRYFLIETDQPVLRPRKKTALTDEAWKVLLETSRLTKKRVISGGWTEPEWKICATGQEAEYLYNAIQTIKKSPLRYQLD